MLDFITAKKTVRFKLIALSIPDCLYILENSLYNVFIDRCKEGGCVIGVGNHLDGRGDIESEDAHDRLCINDISALNEIYIVIEKNDFLYKFSDREHIGELNIDLLHFVSP